MLRLGSLFSGIGGLELGLERGLMANTVYQVENNPYARYVLGRHWPGVPCFEDVRAVGAHNLPAVDILCGGFPCTDLSAANRNGEGLAGERSGLWYEMERIIHETRPPWIVIENVAHTWRRWVPLVRRSLHERGYASLPLRVRACDVGARHERARIFLVAGPHAAINALAADVAGLGLAIGAHHEGDSGEQCTAAGGSAHHDVAPGFGLAPRPWMVRGVHGLPGGLDGAWKRAGWTGARLRRARIERLGNSVVPACAEAVGRLIAPYLGHSA